MLTGLKYCLTIFPLRKRLDRNCLLEIGYLSRWMLNVARATMYSCLGCTL